MKPGPIDIRPVKLKDLYRFASGFAKSGGFKQVAPITLARAKAQMKNPHADENDTVLFAAFDGGRCVGYHGQLPGALSTPDGLRKVYWGSTFYLPEQYRGRGIGARFLKEATGLNHDFVATRITPSAFKALSRFGLKKLGSLTYWQLRVEKSHVSRKAFEFLNEKITLANREKSGHALSNALEKRAAETEKSLFYARIGGLVEKMKKGYRIVETDRIRQADFFRNLPPARPCFFRGPETIDWMLNEKWVFPKERKNREVDGYHFSDTVDLFNYTPLKLYDADRMYRGFMVICVSIHKSKTVVRVLDHDLKTDREIPAACAAALFFARKHRADRVEFPEKFAEHMKKTPFLKKFLKKQKRVYLYCPGGDNSPLEQVSGKIRLDYCDGDIAFT